ncbi:hypothetical protein [Paenibacillus agilis]|uniref:hypothetical protein n=1 Tax=Paenibacillus agilis TaxID=3020863 RepID=UPI0016499505|nr:hypothetical protein [Paenibacillus agilis]
MTHVVQHPNNELWAGRLVMVLGKEFVIVSVCMDGSLILEPKELYGTAESLTPGEVIQA